MNTAVTDCGTIGFQAKGEMWRRFIALSKELKTSQSSLAMQAYEAGIDKAERKLRAEEIRRLEAMKRSLPTLADANFFQFATQ